MAAGGRTLSHSEKRSEGAMTAIRPILFSAPMVRALLDGRKTQTRRVLNPQPFPVGGPFYRPHPQTRPNEWYSVSARGIIANIQKIPYAPGDQLWVREAWRASHKLDRLNAAMIAADCHDAGYRETWAPIQFEADGHRSNWAHDDRPGRYRAARFMPRWAARLTLRVTAVTVERLQDISEEDAIAEGIRRSPHGNGDRWIDYPEGASAAGWGDPRGSYRSLWNSIHGRGAWDANPWVVALTFGVRGDAAA
jgi:hypothetical protein